MSLPITPKLKQIQADKEAAKTLKNSQKKTPYVSQHIQNIRDTGKDLQSIDLLNDLLSNIRDNNELKEFKKKLDILLINIGQQKDDTIKRALNDLQRNYRFAKRSMHVKYIEPELEPEPMSMTDYGYLTDYAAKMIEQIQTIHTEHVANRWIITPYRNSRNELESEIDHYMSITERRGLYKNAYSTNAKTKIKTAISFFRHINSIWRQPDANVYKKKIIYLIDSYQSDPDWDDILRSNFLQRVSSAMSNNFRGYRMFLINLDSNGNISADLFTKKLKDTQLGAQILDFMSDPDDMFIVGYNRLYNILFELMGNLFLMSFVFQYWPDFTYYNDIDSDRNCYWDEYKLDRTVPEENAFAVYIGTGPLQSDNANVVNFHLDNIINGTYQPNKIIRIFAPVTSASNDANVAFDFAAGVIIKIYCINVKPYMCVSKSAREAETFILAGDYMYLKHFPLSYNGKRVTVFEFLQIQSDFNGISPDNINQEQFNQKKEFLRQEIIESFPSFNPKNIGQMSPKRTTENIFSVGGLTRRRSNKGIRGFDKSSLYRALDKSSLYRALDKRRKNPTKKRNNRRRTNKRYNKRKI
jgi:hypothetical protein